MFKISIITVCYNSEKYIECTIQSVINQSYPNVQYIIVDGGSNDKTLEIINKYKNDIDYLTSEPDEGIYDAINKGIRISDGDVIGILNSDDFFADTKILERIASCFEMNNDIDAIYGNVQFVSQFNISKVKRYYSSQRFRLNKFKYGFMPAHPSFYCKRSKYIEHGFYKLGYKIGADFELLLRFLYKNQIKCCYLNALFVNMRTGGISNRSLKSRFILNKEIYRACKENYLKTNYLYIYSKYMFKIFEFIIKK